MESRNLLKRLVNNWKVLALKETKRKMVKMVEKPPPAGKDRKWIPLLNFSPQFHQTGKKPKIMERLTFASTAN